MAEVQSTLLFLWVLITLTQLHFAIPKPLRFSLKLIHRDSPQSPLYPGNISQGERMERLIKYSKARAISLEASLRPNSIDMPDYIRSAMWWDDFLYIALLGIGSPVQFVHWLTQAVALFGHSAYLAKIVTPKTFPSTTPRLQVYTVSYHAIILFVVVPTPSSNVLTGNASMSVAMVVDP